MIPLLLYDNDNGDNNNDRNSADGNDRTHLNHHIIDIVTW